MKNLNYFSGERNRYFYGKLLSVDDFESEQRYMNDKRRLINRFMHGCGVVCGLNITPVGEDAVSLEPGLALDFAGREIIVEKPAIVRLADLDGYADNVPGEERYRYLCIEYVEHEKDPVYGIAGAGEEVCYNKTAEGYHMYLTHLEPQQGGGADAYYEEAKTVYWGNGIRIRQVFPRYVKSGSEFELRLIVENMGQMLPISFGYELVFDCIGHGQQKWMKVTFDEEEYKRSARYEVPVILTADVVDGVRGRAVVREGSFWLKVGDYPIDATAQAESTVEITSKDVQEVIKRQYFEGAMQEITGNACQQSLYLAKISLLRAGNTAVIEGVEEMPFGQYICSDVLSSIQERVRDEEFKGIKRHLEAMRELQMTQVSPEKSESTQSRVAKKDVLIEEGTVMLSLGIGGMAGQRFLSEPIVHGLGLGKVTILAGLAQDEEERCFCYGAPDVFAEEAPVRGAVAARVDTENGTFVLGLRLSEATVAERAVIHWTAVRDAALQNRERAECRLFLKPDMAYLSLRETFHFEAVFEGAADKRLKWSVREATGGTVDTNGMYTAPSTAGIYEIVVKSVAHPEMTATAFAVVRDTHQT